MVAHRHRAERGQQEQHRGGGRRLVLEASRLGAQQVARLGGAARPQRELGPQDPQLAGDGADVAALGGRQHALSLLEPSEPDVRMAGGEEVAGGLDEPARTLHRLGRQLRRSEVGVGGGREAVPRASVLGGALERRGHVLVRPRRGGGELPGALGVVRRQRARDRPVGCAALDRRRPVVRGGAQQRVTERDLARPELDDPGRLGGLQRLDREPRVGERVDDDVAAPYLRRRRDQQRAAGVCRKAREAAREQALERCSRRQRSLDRLATFEFGARQQGGDLVQRQRVAAGGGEHAAGHLFRHRAEHFARRGFAQCAELDRLDAGGELAVRALREQHGDAVRPEPSHCEPQRFERGLIDPLQVVDDTQHRPLLGRQREDAEQGSTDREPRVRRGGLELQGAGQRRGLRRGEPGAQVEHRSAQLGQRGEREVASASSARHLEHGHALRTRDRIAQQRGLPDPGLAAHDQCVAAALTGGVERAPDPRLLRLATDQHVRGTR